MGTQQINTNHSKYIHTKHRLSYLLWKMSCLNMIIKKEKKYMNLGNMYKFRTLTFKDSMCIIIKLRKKSDLVHIGYIFPSQLDTEVDLIPALVKVHKLVEAVLGNH